jgi:hypothetical protein
MAIVLHRRRGLAVSPGVFGHSLGRARVLETVSMIAGTASSPLRMHAGTLRTGMKG